MPDIKNMTQREALEAIARASRGESPLVRVRRATLEEENAVPQINPRVEPPVVDPEVAANIQMQKRIQNPINPETGMPFFSSPDESAPIEDPQEVEKRRLKMQYLQERAKTGQVPEYLKKL